MILRKLNIYAPFVPQDINLLPTKLCVYLTHVRILQTAFLVQFFQLALNAEMVIVLLTEVVNPMPVMLPTAYSVITVVLACNVSQAML